MPLPLPRADSFSDHENRVAAALDNLVGYKAVLLPGTQPVPPLRRQCVTAVCDWGIRDVRRRMPLDIWIDRLQDSRVVPAVERLQELANDLHVLLGHRAAQYLARRRGRAPFRGLSEQCSDE